MKKGNDYSIDELEKQLVSIGYKKAETVTAPGEFAVRGDILDVFNSIDNTPTRFDFFDTNLEHIYQFDFLTYEKKTNLDQLDIVPNKLMLFENEELAKIKQELDKQKSNNQTLQDLW